MFLEIILSKPARSMDACVAVTLLAVLLTGLSVSANAQNSGYQEAPQLRELAEADQLPPVHERLPSNPMVVEPVERVGEYGGTWRTALLGGEDGAWMVRTLGYENLVRWTPEWDGIIPNIAESYEINDESTEFTFYLREGMRWSDGQPFSADDIMFWYEDVFLNEELTPEKPAWLVIGDQPVVVEKVDDYAVKFVFAEPNGLFLQGLADVRGVRPTAHPRHYFEQFHRDYHSENLEQLVREAGVTDWLALFTLKGGGSGADIRWWNSELPTLNGWVTTVGIGESTNRMVAERNPYYWKVDSQGNQLPYIDRIRVALVEDVEIYNLMAVAGELDFVVSRTTLENYPLYRESADRGGYRVLLWPVMRPVDLTIMVNQRNSMKNNIRRSP
jgi:peptide/nickel transport system substrate-binding protein